MNNSVDVFFVQSPLQLISAQEARDFFPQNKSIIFLHVQNKKDKTFKQMEKCLDEHWGRVYWTKNSSKYLNPILFLVFITKIFLKYRNRTKRLFYGEFRNYNYAIYESIIRPKESILLDDGAVTVPVQINYIFRGRTIFKSEGLKGRVFNSTLSKKRRPNLFSFFDLDEFLLPDQINYREKKNKRTIETKDEIYFLGSKMSESGNMSLDDELALLKNVIRLFGHKKVHYLPHRGESKDKISKVECLGFFINNLNEPIESFYLKSKLMPYKIISYYSTALYTCYLNFGHQIELVALDVRMKLSTNVPIDNVDAVYEYYERLGIDVKVLDDN
ncbi:hypothetical protein OAI_11470 [Vibrio cyclitrophicus FF160]|uniref:hypothetical protein n=1 Tax=Vibrio cyclitrophicus TaxID=47951 RepID=UPI0002F92C4D|nr:hypothetical protein [Vibrio cyclitrophicus]OEE81588.1 hypothetical protein OAI_11470 [Vibrio cyclitrophicus FF160]